MVDCIIGQLERQADRAARVRDQALSQWHCPAGCMHNAAGCGRVQFRQQLAPTRAAIQEQQQRLWGNVNRKTVREFIAISTLGAGVRCIGIMSWTAAACRPLSAAISSCPRLVRDAGGLPVHVGCKGVELIKPTTQLLLSTSQLLSMAGDTGAMA